MKLHDIRKWGIYDRIITSVNYVMGDNDTKESKEILRTFIKLVELSESEYSEYKEDIIFILKEKQKEKGKNENTIN